MCAPDRHPGLAALILLLAFAVPAKAQWTQQPQFHTTNDLHDLRLNADGRGIAVGEGNVLLCTIDGGADWDGTGSAAADLMAADLADGVFYFCNILGAQYRETNPATCDNELVAASVAPLNGTSDLEQIDADHGWLAAGGRVWFSHNGWSSFTAVSNIGCPVNAEALYAETDTLAFSAGSDGRIHRIRRLGSTFICSPVHNAGEALADIDGLGNAVFAVGENGTVLQSGNAGDSWSALSALGPVDLVSVQVGSDAVYAAGGQRIYRFDRAMGLWVRQALPGLIGGVRAVHMATVDLGWVVGDNGYIARTDDAGGPGEPILGGIGQGTAAQLPWSLHPNPSSTSVHLEDVPTGTPWRLLALDGRVLAAGQLPADGIIHWAPAQNPGLRTWSGPAILQMDGMGHKLLILQAP